MQSASRMMSDILYWSDVSSPLGALRVIDHLGTLYGVYFIDSSDCPTLAKAWKARTPLIERVDKALAAYFKGEVPVFDLPLAARGTDFQRRVWSRLRQVPHGATLSYGELAEGVGKPGAARAVGGAVGRNPWVIIVPCHRVLATGAKLGGFSSGLSRKRELLELEGIAWQENV